MNQFGHDAAVRLAKARAYATNWLRRHPVWFVTEPGGWVIEDIGRQLQAHLGHRSFGLTALPTGIGRGVVHFGSLHAFTHRRGWSKGRSCRIIVSWNHVTPAQRTWFGTDPAAGTVDVWHATNQRTAADLAGLGIAAERIIQVPLGIDLGRFTPVNAAARDKLRRRFGLPERRFIIGSFQKDGQGWGDGLAPKPEKGPDVFCDVLERLNKHLPIAALLTGPARGYVKQRLLEAGIPFAHHHFADPLAVADCYRAIDLYLISSRIEGGPMAVLESAACGVPLVSTDVGMAAEVVVEGVTGHILPVGDSDGLTMRCHELLASPERRAAFGTAARQAMDRYDWSSVAQQHNERMYAPLLAGIG